MLTKRDDGKHHSASHSASHSRLHGTALLAVLGLLFLLVIKIEFRNPDANIAFYGYGVTVTATILVIMTVSFGLYRDPALTARATHPELLQPDQSNRPLVTYIVAVHNEEGLVHQCIQSMAAQTYPNSETIVVDDASTDNTLAILQQLATRYPFHLLALPTNRGKKTRCVQAFF